MRVPIYAALFAVSSAVAVLSDSWRDGAIGVAASAAFVILESCLQNRQSIGVAVRAWLKGGTEVRVSAAYALRIVIDDKLLLVRGHRYPDQYQPVGGVFKVTAAGQALLAQLGSLPDSLLPVDAQSTGDLRFRLPGRKIPAFLRWFHSTRGRETSVWREFQEELATPGYASAAQFPFIVNEHLRTVLKLRYSDHYQGPELLISEVLEVVLTSSQEQELRTAAATHSHELGLFTPDEVIRQGAVPGSAPTRQVSGNARWLIRA